MIPRPSGSRSFIFHNNPIDYHLQIHLDKAIELLTFSEFYNPTLKLDICLNDGSNYPTLIQKLRGPAFAWGFYDKVVLQGDANYKENYSELHGYKWNLTQLLAHEVVHCLQFDKLCLWKSNPIGKIPNWKQEGYPEYVSRQNPDQTNLSKNIDRLMEAEKTDKEKWGDTFCRQYNCTKRILQLLDTCAVLYGY